MILGASLSLAVMARPIKIMTVFYVGKRVFCMWTKRLPILAIFARAGGKYSFLRIFLDVGFRLQNHWAVQAPKSKSTCLGIRHTGQHRVQPFFPGDDLIRGPAQDEYSSYGEYLH